MDHLIYPGDSAVSPLLVPFLYDGSIEYDGLGHSSYPQRRGWASEENPLAWLFCGPEELARRAQTWLYFGTLSEFVGETIVPLSFRSVEGYLTTKALPGLLRRRRQVFMSSSKREAPLKARPLDKRDLLLKEAIRSSELLEQQLINGTETLALVSCSIKVLLQELGEAKYQFHQRGSSLNPSMPATGPKLVSNREARWKVSTPRAIEHQMALGGWCPAQIYFLAEKYSCKALYFLSGLRVDSNVEHDKCTNRECIANSTDEFTYRPKHTAEGCECSQIGSCSTHIASMIEDGEIPVVSSSFTSDGKPQLRIVPARPQLKYIAISHVWSGGLGNPQENTIPTCQLSQLMYNVKKLLFPTLKSLVAQRSVRSQQHVHFWLDTLCIPVGKSFQNAKRITINKMAKIYSGAAHVLVLDVHLQKMVFKELPVEQALAQILSCSWMFRCWTLQEATLARSCFVQFADKAVALRTNSRELRIQNMSTFLSNGSSLGAERARLVDELSRFLTDLEEVNWQRPGRDTMWSYRKQEIHQAHAFAATWNNFLGRFTTKMEDLHLMIAGMQDFKVAPVRRVAAKDRVKAILKGHAMLPLALLYVPGSRLDSDDPQLRWAPAFAQTNELDCNLGYVKIFSDCLLVVNTGSKITPYAHNMKKFVKQFWFMSMQQIFRYLLFGRQPEPRPSPYVCLAAPPEASLHDHLALEIQSGSKLENLWIEACRFPDDMREKPPYVGEERKMTCILFPNINNPLNHADWYQTQGARFHIRERNDVSLHLTYDCPLKIYAYDRDKVNTRNVAMDSPSDSLPAVFKSVKSSIIPSSYRIFIDCDLSSWPSVPHFFSSLGDPEHSLTTSITYHVAYMITQVIWLPSFIIVLAGASSPRFHMQGHRLPLLYVYIGKVLFATLEGLWRSNVAKSLDRIAWSEEFGSDTVEDSDYPGTHEALPAKYHAYNEESSFFIGLKRLILLIALMAVFLALGFSPNVLSRETRGWAQWAGIMLTVELSLRLLMQVAWLKLASTKFGKWIRRRLIRRCWLWVRRKLMDSFQTYKKSEQEMAVRPFREEEADW